MNISEQIINKILTYRPLTRQEMIDMTEGANHIMKHHYLRILSGYELKLLNLLKVDSSCWYSGWNLLFFLAKGTLESKLQGGHIRPIKTFDLDTPAGIITPLIALVESASLIPPLVALSFKYLKSDL